MRISLPMILLLLTALPGPMCAVPAHAATTFSVPDDELPDPLVLVAYGDMRFTQITETDASNPRVRQAMVAKIASENPAAIFLNGDTPWHGVAADFAGVLDETLPRGAGGPRV